MRKMKSGYNKGTLTIGAVQLTKETQLKIDELTDTKKKKSLTLYGLWVGFV